MKKNICANNEESEPNMCHAVCVLHRLFGYKLQIKHQFLNTFSLIHIIFPCFYTWFRSFYLSRCRSLGKFIEIHDWKTHYKTLCHRRKFCQLFPSLQMTTMVKVVVRVAAAAASVTWQRHASGEWYSCIILLNLLHFIQIAFYNSTRTTFIKGILSWEYLSTTWYCSITKKNKQMILFSGIHLVCFWQL